MPIYFTPGTRNLKLRTQPADNFSSIAPDQDFVAIELWKEYGPTPKWRIEKPGRTAVMDGQSTVLFIKPDYAMQLPTPSKSAFDTQWLLEIANLNQALKDELSAIKRHGWSTTVTQEKGADGKSKSVVTVEVKSGYPNDDYLKNAFFTTADTRRVYFFDDDSGVLSGARIYLRAPAGDKLIFELEQIECNPTLASDLFQLKMPENVSWHKAMEILPDNEKYVAMDAEQAARVFIEACGREDWIEAGKFLTLTGSIKEYLGGVKLIKLGKPFTSLVSMLNGAQFVPYEIKLKNGSEKKHNLSLKRDTSTKRWFVDGGF
ncbi:MAG: hypothetical protein WA705_03305 [Candidatus Ozemobacteraceae bacterium]